MGMPAKGEGRYTVADYLSWTDEGRWELIHGVVYDMAPAPLLGHQEVLIGLATNLVTALDRQGSGRGGGGPCRVMVAPVDVVLGPDTVVQPDLLIVCDPARLANGKYVDGPPDLVVEILSPRTALKDRREKRAIYEESGVPLYLIVDHMEGTVELYRRDQAGHYGPPTVFGPEDTLELPSWPGVVLDIKDWISEREAQ